MDVTPRISEHNSVVQSYGDGRFKISGDYHEGAVIVLPDRVMSWRAESLETVDADSLSALLSVEPRPEILLLGSGDRQAFLPPARRQRLKDGLGMAIDCMDSGAACRTFNVLMAEGRRVAAALLPVGKASS